MRCTEIALLCGALVVAAATNSQVTPVEKVLTLMEELKTEVEDEGKSEAKLYDEFACFCKDTTKEKSDAIKTEQDNIEEYAAAMQENTELSAAKGVEIQELDQEIADITKHIEQLTAMREAEVTQYEATAADLGKGVSSLEGAISDAKSGQLSLLHVKASVKRSLIMADALDLAPQHSKAIAALLQTEDAPDGGADYENHAAALIATFEDLDKQFLAKKAAVDQQEGQNKKDFNQLMQAKTGEKEAAETAKADAEEAKDGYDEALAQATDNMVSEEATLKDDQLYLKDLTAQCELKAREWDQQSAMRASEVAALTKALEIMNAKVAANSQVNARALIQESAAPVASVPQAKDTHVDIADADIGDLDMSFLQTGSLRNKLTFLAKASPSAVSELSRRDKAMASLAQRSSKLKSPILEALVLRAAADPFLKVKKLIQDLIEKLVTEAAEEASKKGFCDTETGKAESTRNTNMAKVNKINAETKAAEATKAQLEETIATLTAEIAELNDVLTKTTKERTAERADNMDTLDKAKEGLAAVKDAYDVLASFYKGAGKAKVSLVQMQASPVQGPAGSAGGAYKGNQAKGGGILAMLEVIISDFERTIKVTTKSEKEAAKEFTKFERTTKASIASKETSKSTAEFDLKDTEMTITENMDDLEKHQKMLDDALKTLEDLKPACVDTGMSYADRVQKRRDEIDALKEALCQLDAEKVEAECQ